VIRSIKIAARVAVAFATVAAAGCGGEFQSVRMDIPVGAKVTINAGVYTPKLSFVTPFVGRFEIGSLDPMGGIPIEFSLAGDAARRYGSERPITIYGRLSVGNPTDFARTQTLRLAPSEDRIKSLVQGAVSEIEAFVVDPNEDNRRLAVITMRMAPF
jgi:hypothetical protein